MIKNTTPINTAIAKMLSDKDIENLNKEKLSDKIGYYIEKLSYGIKYTINLLLNRK